ncbi:hypothetical protein BU17DRAFT_63664 [Hysterangium stoloniferum]|nr:hypothetical protein BU17DRAFT_63664 [Hysterangium stoloniferum]
MAATLASYDWIITLDQEISPSHTQYKSEHIWRKKWTLPNSLCIIARYFGLAFILFLTVFVSMSSVREVDLDFFASVATQGYSFIRSHSLLKWVHVSDMLAFLLFSLTVTIISIIIMLFSIANPGMTAVMVTFIPLLYQIALRRASLGIKALP